MRLLPPDSTVALVAPAGMYDPARLQDGLARLQGWNLRTEVLRPDLRPHRYLAGPDDDRLDELVRAFTDPRYGAVWAIRGGYGVTRLLDRLPWDRLQPKPLLGFSDLTPLLDAVHRRLGALAVHAPVVHQIPALTPDSLTALRALFDGGAPAPLRGTVWQPGTATAPLVGGNLAMIAATVGTPWQLSTAGCLLLLEDVGEPTYRLDRMLQQLRQGGLLDDLAGVVLGEWAHCRAVQGDHTVDDVLREALLPLGVPVLADLPIGHGAAHHPVVLGRPATLAGDQLHLAPPVHLAPPAPLG